MALIYCSRALHELSFVLRNVARCFFTWRWQNTYKSSSCVWLRGNSVGY